MALRNTIGRLWNQEGKWLTALLTRYRAPAVFLLGLLFCSAGEAQQQTSQTIITPAGTVARLGGAYSSSKEQFLGGDCLDGTTHDPIGAAESSFALDETISETQLSKELGFSVGGRARFGAVEASASADFLSRSTSNSFSVSSIYKAYYYFPVRKLRLTAHKLSPLGDSVDANYERWNTTCGDFYVDELVTGAKLFISIRIDFSSSQQKQDFQAHFSIAGPLYSANADMKTASDQFSKDSKVTVSAYQLGGDVSKITGVFGNDEDRIKLYTQCTLGNFSSCSSVLQNALIYATNTATGFPSQLGVDSKPGPATLSYVIKPYSAAGIYGKNYPFLDAAVGIARDKLAAAFEQAYRQNLSAKRLLAGTLEPDRRKAIEAASANIQQNINTVLDVSKICYDTPDQCPAAITHKLNLIAIDEQFFLPNTFSSLCVRAMQMTGSEPLRMTISALVDTVDPDGFQRVKDLTDCRVYEGMLKQRPALSIGGGSRGRLSDLSPLEGFGHLEKLDISNNDVVDLSPLSSLSELSELIANNNKISDIRPIEYLSQLRILELSGNRIINAAPIGTLKALSKVSVRSNHIADITPFAELKELRRLDISHNNIEKLDAFATPYRLEWLNIDDNLIPGDNVKAFLTKFAKTCIPITTSSTVDVGFASASASFASCMPH